MSKSKKKIKIDPKDQEIQRLKNDHHGLQTMILGAFRKEEILAYLVQDVGFAIEDLEIELEIAEDFCEPKKEIVRREKSLKSLQNHYSALKEIQTHDYFKDG